MSFLFGKFVESRLRFKLSQVCADLGLRLASEVLVASP